MEGVVEAIEVIEQTNHRRQLDDLAVVEVLFELGPDVFIHAMRVGGHPLGQRQRGALGWGEAVRMLVNVVHRIQQVLGNA